MKFIVTDIHGVQHEHEADDWRTSRYGLQLVNQCVDYETVVVCYAKGKWISVVTELED